MILNTTKDKGRAGISMAIAYFGSNGYTVSIPLNDTQKYDLVVEKDGILQSVQCKFAGESSSEPGVYDCALRTVGAKGTLHGTVKDSGVDLLFCLRGDGIMYNIPVKAITNKATMRLITEKTPSTVFDTSLYIVSL